MNFVRNDLCRSCTSYTGSQLTSASKHAAHLEVQATFQIHRHIKPGRRVEHLGLRWPCVDVSLL